ncbi:unnamed protein product, partial [Linum tenue]
GQWCTRVPLICFGTVEWHLPDRCLRQFGREQCIPLEVPDSQRAFHGRDGRQGTRDWPTKLAKFITIWENRQSQDIVTPTQVGRMGYHDPYLDRYRQTSVRYMTPEGAADGALADGIERIKDTTTGRIELGNEDVSFIRRMANSLFGYIKAQGRDNCRYPPMPAPPPPPVQVDVPDPPPPYERKKSKRVRERP